MPKIQQILAGSRLVPGQKCYWWGVGIFLAVLLVRIQSGMAILESPFPPHEQKDMGFYHHWASRIIAGRWTDGYAFYGLPGYAFFLAGIYRVFGLEPALVVFLQCFTDAATAFLIFAISRLTFAGRGGVVVGVVGGLAWAFYQPAAVFSGVLMPTVWAVICYWALVFWAIRAAGKPFRPIWPWPVMGVCAGVMAMAVATVLFALPLVFASAFISAKRRFLAAALAAGLAVAGAYVGMTPCWAYNRFVAGDPVLLSAHSGLNFFVGNNPDANGYPRMPLGVNASQSGMLGDSIAVAEKAAGRPLKRGEVSAYWTDRAKAFIREQPGAWLRLMALKVRNLWSGWEYDDLALLEVYRQGGQILPGLRFGVIAALGLPGLIWACARHRAALWIAAAVALHMAALMPVFVTERYRLAMAPGLIVGVAFGLWAAVGAIRRGRWMPFAGWLAGVAAMGWIAAWKPTDPRLLALSPYSAGIKLLAAGDLAAAAPRLERAAGLVPNNAEVQFALGNLRYEQKRPQEALGHYRAALGLVPEHAGAWNNVGVIAMESGDFGSAAAAFGNALAREPARPRTWRLLAECRAALGDRAGAREAVEKALELAPDDPAARALRDSLEGEARDP